MQNTFGMNAPFTWRVTKHALLALPVALSLALAGCGGTSSSSTTSPSSGAAAATQAPVATDAPVATEEPAADSTTSESEPATSAPAAGAAGAQTSDVAGVKTFVIDPEQSEVRFILTEVLMGQHTVVTGRGNGIQGDVTVDFDNYGNSKISPVIIDASQLATENNMRNGQIRRAILQTNNPDYQYITFTPTEISGMPENAEVGQPFDISVTGDLTIRDTTKPITFAITVTPVSQDKIQGSAKATLMREDFDLQIPSVPTVADVSPDVQLEFDFVANAQ